MSQKTNPNNTKEETTDVSKIIDTLVNNANQALKAYMDLNQEQVNNITKSMALAGLDQHMYLAKLAIEETGRGIYEDKITKNLFASEYIYNNIKYEKTVGCIDANDEEDYMEIAEPVGVVAGITPVTNPTSTTMFKSIISAKTRNPIIFAFHPSAQKCSYTTAKILRDAAIEAGAPEHCIQWIEQPSIEATNLLMKHTGVSLILATGGSGMVKSAYSSGKPALGVGPGNVPCFIEKTAQIERSATDLVLSKSFDNGMVCASEQAVIIEEPIYNDVTNFMKTNKCYFTTPEETKQVERVVISTETSAVNPKIVGKSPYEIAGLAGVSIPQDTKVLCCEIEGIGEQYPLSREKLSPVLAVVKAKDVEDGIQLCEKAIALNGLGHSAVLHSKDSAVIEAFSERMKAGRVIINQPSTHGAIGDLYNTNIPSLTLGCGSYGKNSTTSNVTAVHLINKKRVAKRRVNMQWFKIPEKIYFEYGAIQYLSKMPDISRACIITDPLMIKLGFVDKILYHLRNRRGYVHCEIFSDVEPDPSIETVFKGVDLLNSFNPDVIIALGGGSPMDAAKGMWMFYEHPEADFSKMALKFMDIRKRVYKYPKNGSKAKFVAIPTTSGTGSEVTSFAVITDKENNIKYPLADYELTPDVAIVDPDFVMTVPPAVTANTGMDTLTHGIEAYVSVLASDYTDALAIKAIELVCKYLPLAYKDGNNKLAREKMHNASCIAGMAFTNAFLGINHSLAHKLGGEYHIPHGAANALLLPYVIEYNGEVSPSKFASWPKYETFVAPKKYAQIAKHLGLPCKTEQEGVKSLANKVRELNKELNVKPSIKSYGIDEQSFLKRVPYLADKAFEDQCTTANPRMPLVSELAEIYKRAYYGK